MAPQFGPGQMGARSRIGLPSAYVLTTINYVQIDCVIKGELLSFYAQATGAKCRGKKGKEI